MRTSMRALRVKPTQFLVRPVNSQVGTPWRRFPAPGVVNTLSCSPFSSTSIKASLEKQRKDEFERVSQEIEHGTETNRQQRTDKSNYWYLGLLLPLAVFCFWMDQKDDGTIWKEKHLTPFTIIKRENVSSTAFILTVRPQFGQHNLGIKADPYANFWDQGTWAVKIVQPELQIARYYTPLPPLASDRPEELRFLIRKVEDGEVSVYLDRQAVGAMVRLYGPVLAMTLPDSEQDVVFLAGGTGIAPAMGLAYSILERKQADDGSKIHILWANRRREDCLGGESQSGGALREGVRRNRIVKELDDLQRKYPDRLYVDYLVDEERTSIDESKILQAMKSISPLSTSTKVIVSGPEGFVEYFAGPMKWEDGQQKQGPLGGLLGRMNLKEEDVFKL